MVLSVGSKIRKASMHQTQHSAQPASCGARPLAVGDIASHVSEGIVPATVGDISPSIAVGSRKRAFMYTRRRTIGQIQFRRRRTMEPTPRTVFKSEVEE